MMLYTHMKQPWDSNYDHTSEARSRTKITAERLEVQVWSSHMTGMEKNREIIRKLEGQARRSSISVSRVPERTEETEWRKSFKKTIQEL